MPAPISATFDSGIDYCNNADLQEPYTIEALNSVGASAASISYNIHLYAFC